MRTAFWPGLRCWVLVWPVFSAALAGHLCVTEDWQQSVDVPELQRQLMCLADERFDDLPWLRSCETTLESRISMQVVLVALGQARPRAADGMGRPARLLRRSTRRY